MINVLKNNKITQGFKEKSGNETGFTLLEMAIVLIIGGIMLSLMGTALLAYMKKSRIEKTEVRIEKIQEALEQYLRVNRAYPCAAPRNVTLNDPAFGRVPAACNAAPPAIHGNATVVIGAVPTRTLNLPDEYGADGWGNKLTYAVTRALTNSGSYSADGGRIDIYSSANTTIFPTASLAHYVIVSNGPTGEGAYALSGTAPTIPCPAATQDAENCDNDGIFRTTLFTSDTGATFYDDYFLFQGQTEPVAIIEPGAVMAYDADTCPQGWSPYNRAVGRFIVGGTNPSGGLTNENIYGVLVQQASQPSAQNVPLSVTGSEGVDFRSRTGESPSASRTLIPPYLALLYCIKN